MASSPTEATYTLADLENWDQGGTSFAVVGFPVRHSISPAMQNAAMRKLVVADSRFNDWRYYRFEVNPEDLQTALVAFARNGFAGLNLTVPHKEIVIPWLEAVSPEAKLMGAVNTLVRSESGYSGQNSDGYGLAAGVKESLGIDLAGSHVAVLGAGGAGRAATVQAILSGCKSLTLVNRNQERLGRLARDTADLARAKQVRVSVFSSQNSSLAIEKGALLINATSLGLNDDDPLPLPIECLDQTLSLFDMIYNPTETALMRGLRQRGGRVANGLSMLVHQGVRSLEIWSGQSVDADAMAKAALAALAIES